MAPPAGYIPGFVCTLETCSVSQWGFVKYQPSMAGNALFLALIYLLIITHVILLTRPQIRAVLISMLMIIGLGIESTGYIARLLLHGNPFSRDFFLIYLICLTLGPVFFAAAIYLCLGRIVVVYGEGLSRFKPGTYTIFFVGCDVLSLVVQGVGGGIAASYPLEDEYMIDMGTNILVAGLSIQVASLFAFTICFAWVLFNAWRNRRALNPDFAELHQSRKFKLFLAGTFLASSLLVCRLAVSFLVPTDDLGLAIATMCIFIRSIFRSVELSEGFSGHLANNEISFMVLDGVMIIVACIVLTATYPGIAFGRENWKRSGFKFRNPKSLVGEVEMTDSYGRREKNISDVSEREEPKTSEIR